MIESAQPARQRSALAARTAKERARGPDHRLRGGRSQRLETRRHGRMPCRSRHRGIRLVRFVLAVLGALFDDARFEVTGWWSTQVDCGDPGPPLPW